MIAPEAHAGRETASGATPGASLARRYRRFVLRRIVWLTGLAVGLALAFLLNITTGAAGLSLSHVVGGILDPGSLSRPVSVIIWDVRLPIAVMAIAVGASLGLAGAEMQTVLNNPLASPSTLGLMHAATLGASLAIVLAVADLFEVPENYVVPVCAFMGSMAAVALLLVLSRMFGATADTVILFGIAIVFTLDALIALMQFSADSDSLQKIVFWTMGSLARATWEKAFIVLGVLALSLPASVVQVWKMTALRGGEEYARSFGIAVGRLRLLVLFRVAVLTAVAVSFTGVIGFVGLVGPHIARLAVGEDHRFFLPASALAGAFILSAAAVLSKSLIAGILVPDGIVTALIGIPLFLALLFGQRRVRS